MHRPKGRCVFFLFYMGMGKKGGAHTFHKSKNEKNSARANGI